MKRPLLLLLSLACSVPAVARPQDLLYTFQGDSAGDRLGYAVAAAGDVDADGHPDVAVGAPGDPARKLRVFSGRDGSFLFALRGRDTGDFYPASLAGAGDLDGDGYDDLLALGWLTFPDAFVQAISGRTREALFDVDVEGRRLAAAGDLDGDGVGDVVVGGQGRVTTLSGVDGSVLWTVSGGSSLGTAVDAAGDVDGDGRGDVLVGAHFESSGGRVENGVVRVLSGVDGSELLRREGAEDYDWLGRSVAGVGDVDGDGRADLAAMADIELLFSSAAPYVTVWSGADGGVLASRTVPDTVLRSALDGTSDLDGDGRGELLLAYSSLSGPEQVLVLDGADLGTLVTWESIFENGALAFLGDVDGDGLGEVLVGDLELDPQGPNSGEARVFRLPCLSAPTSYCTAAPNSAGRGALLAADGSTSLAANDLELRAGGLPAGVFGLFFYGPEAVEEPFGDGFRCVGAGGAGTFRLGPPLLADGSGSLARSLDFDSPPLSAGPGAVRAGSTWYFQLWYRDPLGPLGSGFNLSDGLRVLLCP